MWHPRIPGRLGGTAHQPSIRRDLHRSIERGELVLHFQPKFDLRTDRITGAEALVRWDHPRLGLLPPDSFIPIAEETGFIASLGAWVLEQACTQAVAWQAMVGQQFTIAVNLSPRQFRFQRVELVVADVLRRTGLAPELLELEVTEGLALDQDEAVTVALSALQAMRVRCSLDDFGTGYCGLSYLDRYPVSGLKIDKSFMAAIGETADGDAPIVRAIISLAQELTLDVIAEGVETERQLEYLRSAGCHEVQGFLLSHPLPPDELEVLLVLDDGPHTEVGVSI